MIASVGIQNKYLDLYKIMRNYLWDVDTLENLSDVEVEIFTRFVDKSKLQHAIRRLKRDIQPTFSDDEELKDAFTDLEELIDSIDTQYAELYNTSLIKGKGYR